MRAQRQAVVLLDLAHHGQHRLHRDGIRLDEVRLHQRQVLADGWRALSSSRCPAQRASSRTSRPEFRSTTTEMMPTPPSEMTGSVTASSPEKTRKSSGTALHTSAICEMLPLASFTPMMLGISASRASVAGSMLRRCARARCTGSAACPRPRRWRGSAGTGLPASACCSRATRSGSQSTPGIAATVLAFSTASRVLLEVAPATIGTRPRVSSIVTSITRSHSSRESVGVSPVVPQGTRKSMPLSTCHAPARATRTRRSSRRS